MSIEEAKLEESQLVEESVISSEIDEMPQMNTFKLQVKSKINLVSVEIVEICRGETVKMFLNSVTSEFVIKDNI